MFLVSLPRSRQFIGRHRSWTCRSSRTLARHWGPRLMVAGWAPRETQRSSPSTRTNRSLRAKVAWSLRTLTKRAEAALSSQSGPRRLRRPIRKFSAGLQLPHDRDERRTGPRATPAIRTAGAEARAGGWLVSRASHGPRTNSGGDRLPERFLIFIFAIAVRVCHSSRCGSPSGVGHAGAARERRRVASGPTSPPSTCSPSTPNALATGVASLRWPSRFGDSCLALPFFGNMTEDEVDYVCRTLAHWVLDHQAVAFPARFAWLSRPAGTAEFL